MSITLRPERPAQHAAARRVHERAFPTTAEADLVDALRAEGAVVPELCLVALDGDGRGGAVLGHIVFSRARLDSGTPLLVLAPIAVHPDAQRRGIGRALVREALRRAPAAAPGVPLVSVLGDAAYYPRFGFEPAAPLGIRAPFDVPEDAWMVFRLPAYPADDRPRPEGTVVYADAFAAVV